MITRPESLAPTNREGPPCPVCDQVMMAVSVGVIRMESEQWLWRWRCHKAGCGHEEDMPQDQQMRLMGATPLPGME